MNEKLNEALEQVSDKYLAQASQPRHPHPAPWLAAIATVVAVAVLVSGLLPGMTAPPDPTIHVTPTIIPAPQGSAPAVSDTPPGSAVLLGQISGPEYPQLVQYPEDHFGDYEGWYASQRKQYDQPEGYADSLEGFFLRSIPMLLSGDQTENTVCSPVNIYMALAMLAECTDGSSRQQVLQLLGASTIQDLRTQADHVWNAHYRFDGLSTSVLGSSLWLDENYRYDRSTVKTLSDRYYASVFQGALGSSEMNASLQKWLDDQTGGLLTEQAQGVEMSEDTALALATTIFYRAKWVGFFNEKNTTTDIFHSPQGDLSWAFMHTTLLHDTYYSGEGYGAISLSLQDGSRMWLVLPDEDETPQSLLTRGDAVGMILGAQSVTSQKAKINLSMPRFDVCAETDLVPAMKALGICDVFSEANADFTAILPDAENIVLGTADHAARVAVDEEGIVAAAYTVMLAYATGAPEEPELKINFVLDRPFLFVITSADGLPLFTGVVNQP